MTPRRDMTSGRMARGLLAALGCFSLFASGAAAADRAATDWPFLDAYRAQNASLPPARHRVVFMGDSITEFWDKAHLQLFADPAYVNRGISGQTTPQMLVRFRQDVINLHPEAVVILAGTNDIAGNTGPATPEMIEDNLASMCDLAHAHGIKVALGLILPVARYPWAPELKPVPAIATVNAWIVKYAGEHGYAVIDFFTPMVDESRGLKHAYSEDGVHPNAAGYDVMAGLVHTSLARIVKAD